MDAPRTRPFLRAKVQAIVLAITLAACGQAPAAVVLGDAPAPAASGSLALVRVDPVATRSDVVVVPAGSDTPTTLTSSDDGTFTGVDWAPGAGWLAATHVGREGGELRRVDPRGTATTTTWSSPRPVTTPRVAPGGARVAVASTTRDGGSDLVIVSDGGARVVARAEGHAPEPPWACAPLGPTGLRPVGWLDDERVVVEVAASCHEVLVAALVVITLAGDTAVLLDHVDPGTARIGPDARTVTATRPDDGEVVRVDVASGEVEPLGTGLATTESRDRALAAVRPDPGAAGADLRLVVAPPGRDLDDAREVTSLRDVTDVSWRPDGDEVAALVQRERGSQLWLVVPSSGDARRVDGGTATSVVVDLDHADG